MITKENEKFMRRCIQLAKLGAANRTEAVATAIRKQLIRL